MNQVSYSGLEQTLRKKFRNKVSAAESTEDVKKFFFQTAQEVIESVLEGKVRLGFGDIALDAERPEGYRFNARFRANRHLEAVWGTSDLRSILGRFAETAVKRLKHLEKNPDKTEAKINHRI